MAEAALKLPEETIPPAIRRFEIPDLQKHGGWIIQRLYKARPSLNERQIMTWLKGCTYSNEYSFLYQEHAVGMAQIVREETLDSRPIVRERFVFAEEGFAPQAAVFYSNWKTWAGHLGAEMMIVEELSDVPHEMIRPHLGRIFERKVLFARL